MSQTHEPRTRRGAFLRMRLRIIAWGPERGVWWDHGGPDAQAWRRLVGYQVEYAAPPVHRLRGPAHGSRRIVQRAPKDGAR